MCRSITFNPATLTQNAFMERFNRTCWNEVFNLYLFRILEGVREIMARRVGVHNEYRPP
ncbi:MAG: transposase [Nitrospiraceae bacterium]|nr:integrase core domain-containing protein [Nitrospira sp.]MCB9775660.1 transposase [Nitrospiraceae bacterium]